MYIQQSSFYLRSRKQLAEGIDQPGKVANDARGQLNRENVCFFPLAHFAPESLNSRDGFGCLPAEACSFSTLQLHLVLTHGHHFFLAESNEQRGWINRGKVAMMLVVS